MARDASPAARPSGQASGESPPGTEAGTIAGVRERWFSKRAVSLHLAALVFVPGCALAAWWQINRAADGNQLSYLYSVMWPVFGVLGIVFWWMLLHTDYDTVGLKGMQRQAKQEASVSAAVNPNPIGTWPPASATATTAAVAAEDPEMAAYNARLAELAAKGRKTWRNPESVVARRSQ